MSTRTTDEPEAVAGDGAQKPHPAPAGTDRRLALRAWLAGVRMGAVRRRARRLSRRAHVLARRARTEEDRAHERSRRAAALRQRSKEMRRRSRSTIGKVKGERAEREAPPKTRFQKERRQRVSPTGHHSTWRYVIESAGSQEGLRLLLGAGLFGRSLPRRVSEPDGDRILVLVPHQDDEGIGAAGTLLAASDAGKAIRIVYFTDGATTLPGLEPEEVSRLRYAEARRAWRGVAGVELEFLGYPTGTPDVPRDAVARLEALIDEFDPDTIFVPTFLEEPYEHRLLNRWLLAIEDRLDASIDTWAYQVTTRVPGNTVVDVTDVQRRKRRLNSAWRSQNAFNDYAHLASGQDIANSIHLKGAGVVKDTASYAEVFQRFPAPEYLDLCRAFLALEQSFEASIQSSVAPPDFLVVGLQKSGTYWLTAMLDAHPQVRCFPSRPAGADGSSEAHLFDVAARLDEDFEGFGKSMSKRLGGYFADLVPAEPPEGAQERADLLERLAERFSRYCDEQRREHGKPFVGEKTTETVHHPDLVEAMFPGIRKLAILRDPRDRVVSFHFHEARKGRRDAETIDADFVDAYVERVRRDYAGLLAMPDPCFALTYESLAADPTAVLGELLRFLGAYSSEQHARALVEAGSFEALTGRRPGAEDASSYWRRGAVGDWRTRLEPELAQRTVAGVEDLTRGVEERFALDLAAYRAA